MVLEETLLRLDADPPASVLAAFAARLRAQRARALRSGTGAGHPAPRPFLALTPLGLPHRAVFEGLLDELDIRTEERVELPDWAAQSTLLYVRSFDALRLVKAWMFEELWRARFPSQSAWIWFLSGPETYRKLIQCKPRIRDGMHLTCRVGVALPCVSFTAHLHPFHVPDPEHWRLDCAYLRTVCKNF